MISARPSPKPRFFRTPAAFRTWLERHHADAAELWVGFYKVKSGKGGMVYQQALDEALCYGWIDGIVRALDEERYVQRFTPRRTGSTWSLVNTRKVKLLIERGLMRPAGLAAFERRDGKKPTRYSFEQQHGGLSAEYQARLEADAAARRYFESQPPGYRRTAAWWVMSAKKEETRARRFETLLEDCAAGRRLRVTLVSRAAREENGRG